MANTTWEAERFANLNKLLCECMELEEESTYFEQLKKQLEKLKPDLAGLLEYPGKSPQHRAELEKGTPTINGEKFKVSADFVTEAKKLSDFLELDEDIASALLHAGVSYEKKFELPAAESSIILFFSDREAKLLTLDSIIRGGANSDLAEFIQEPLDRYVGEILSATLKAGGKMFPERVLETIDELSKKKDKITAILNGPTADIPYQRDVVELVCSKLSEERKLLAMLVFDIIRNYQLNPSELIAVISWLRNSNVEDPTTLRMAVSLLFALNTCTDGPNKEVVEANALDKIHHLVNNKEFLLNLNTEILDKTWKDDGLKGLVWLQWALLVLFGIKRSPNFDQLIGYREDRVEKIAEEAVQMGAYRFAVDYLLGYRISDTTEYDLSAEFEVLRMQHTANEADSSTNDAKKYPHFTDLSLELQWHIEHILEETLSTFIGRMSSLIRRMRYDEEDAIYQAQQAERLRAAQEEQRQQQLQQLQQQQILQGGYKYGRFLNNNNSNTTEGDSASLASKPRPRRDTEGLFLWITVLYADRPDAALRFWGNADGGSRFELDDRLAVFLRWGSDSREQGMIRGYFNMLSSLACGPQSSFFAYTFMNGTADGAIGIPSPSRSQIASNQAPLCSWSALFGALDFYAKQMRQSSTDPLATPPEILPAEVSLLCSLLRLCRSVVRFSIVARTALYDNQVYNPIVTMFNLLGCVVPISLKAALIDTIAAFCDLGPELLMAEDDSHMDNVRLTVDEIARRTWSLLEQSQILPTTNDLDALRSVFSTINNDTGESMLAPFDRTPHHKHTVGRSFNNSSNNRSSMQSRGGIAYELEEVEASAETYPELRAFLRLVSGLIHISGNAPALSNMERDPVIYSSVSPSVPTKLGDGYRIPGISPYISFVLDNVFLRADQRPYCFSSEKWDVYALSLDIIERCLATLDLSGILPNSMATLNNDNLVIRLRSLVTHPGFEIAIRVLCGSKLLDGLLNILNVGVDTLNGTTGEPVASVGSSVLSALRILLRILRLQDALLRDVIPVLVESIDALEFPLNLPRSLTTLDQLLLTRRSAVVQIVTYISCIANTDIQLASVKILHILSDSVVFNGIDDSTSRGANILTLNRLVSMIDSSDESVRILHGFINCLELADDDISPESQANALIVEAAKGFTSGLEDQQSTSSAQSIRMAIIDLLLANLSPKKPAPTIAHWLLGFSLTKPASDDLPDPSQRATCLHTILDLLYKDGQTESSTDDSDDVNTRASVLLTNRPRLAERCYHLIHHLCSDPVTSEVTMRYLRARDEFFYSQIIGVPAVIVPNLSDFGNQKILLQSSASSNLEDEFELDIYSPIRVYAQMHARAWLWRSTALELHSLVLQDSRSRAKHLIEWLIGDVGHSVSSDSQGNNDSDVFNMLPGKGGQAFLDSRMRLLYLFDCLRQSYRDSSYVLRYKKNSTEREYLSSENRLGMDCDDDTMTGIVSVYDSDDQPENPFDTDILNVDVNSCLVMNERGCSVFDLHALVALLRSAERALNAAGELNSTNTRQRVYAIIRRLVIRCYFANQERELFFAYASALRGWKEIAEVIITSAWDKIERGGRSGRERAAFQLLKGLVQVVSENDPIYGSDRRGVSSAPGAGWWIEPPTAEQETRHTELLTTLAPTLTLFTEKLSFEWTRSGTLTRASLAMNKPGAIGQSRDLPPATSSQLPAEPLLDVWRHLVSSALTPAAQSSLQLRGNVYSSMLHFLSGVRKLSSAASSESSSAGSTSVGLSKGSAARSKFVSGILDIITDTALGDRLFDSVSADAADASDAWKAVAFVLLDSLAALFSLESRPNRIIMYLTRKNFFPLYIGTILRREDAALQATLHPDPASLNPIYIYEAKMAFFLRLSQRQDGAEKLIENGIIDVLADCTFIDLKPSVSSGSDGTGTSNYADAFIPARSERYHQLLMPALDLLLSLVTKIGKDNITVWMKAVRFVSQHYSVIESILKEAAVPTHQLTNMLLTEVKAITAILFYICRQRAVLDREMALAGSGHVGVATLHLPLLALLPKFGMSYNWISRLQTTNDVERTQAQLPVSMFDIGANSSDGNQAEADKGGLRHTIFGRQACELVDSIVRNVISYAQAVTEQGVGNNNIGRTQQQHFRPAFSWTIEHSRESDYTPSLATLVSFIRRSISQVERGRKIRDERLRLAKNPAAMTTADQRKLVRSSPYIQLSDDLSTEQMRTLAANLLKTQGKRIARSVALLVASVEQALVLLWRHLAYFSSTQSGTAYSSSGEHSAPSVRVLSSSIAMPNSQEQEILRSDASIALPPLLTSLSELKITADEVASFSTHNSFVQMLVRRIKDLVFRDDASSMM